MAIMNIQSSVQCFHWCGYNLLVCDYPRSTVLMMYPALSHYSLEGEDQGKQKWILWRWPAWIQMMEVRVSCVWEREGES